MPALLRVLEAAGLVDGVDGTTAGTFWTPWLVATACGDTPGGTGSAPGDGRVSWLAAQATEARSAKEISTGMDEYLLNKVRCIS